MMVFDNSRWGALNTNQKAVLAMLDQFTDRDKKVIAHVAVTYACDEVLATLRDVCQLTAAHTREHLMDLAEAADEVLDAFYASGLSHDLIPPDLDRALDALHQVRLAMPD